MTSLSIGDEWSLTPMPNTDGVLFEMLDQNFPAVLLFFDRPSKQEIAGIQSGKLKMGFYGHGCVLFLLIHIEGVAASWMQAPFSIRKYDKSIIDYEHEETFHEGQGMPFYFFLIDRLDKTIQAMRFITASHDFSVAFRHELSKQYREPFSNEIYDSEVSSVFQNFSIKELTARGGHFFRAGTR